MRARGKTVVVTGGGNGIGRELVLELLRRGARVAAVDRDKAGLDETVRLAGEGRGKVSTHVVDLTSRAQVEALPAAVVAAHGQVDGLINCAGVIQPFVRVNDLGYDAIDRVLQVNLYGPIHTTKAFLPLLLKRPQAHLVNVSSMGGFVPVPGQTLYCASKAAVKLLTEGLASELEATKVEVSVVFPGAVATEISKNSGVAVPSAGGDGRASITPTPAPKAAAVILDGMEKGKARILVGSDAKAMDKLSRLAPLRAAKLIAKQMRSLLPKPG